MKTILETDRLVLREITPDDKPALEAILQDEQTMYAYEGAFSDAETQAWLDRMLARYAKDDLTAAGLTHVDAGVAALTNRALDLLKTTAARPSLESDLYTRLIERRTLLAHETQQRFYDIGTPERLAVIEEFLAP